MRPALPSQAPAPEATALVRELIIANRLLFRLSLGPAGLSLPEHQILSWLLRFPGCTASQLALDLHLDVSTLTPVLQALLERRLLGRLKDPRDGRRALLRATEAGRTACVAGDQALRALVEEAERGLGDRGTAPLRRFAEGLAAAAGRALSLSDDTTTKRTR